ncbi:acyl-CoA dehydrogenase [Candidatus Zixiibacteriota bacterium]
MDFRLTEEQEFIKQAARDFAQNEIKPGAGERDEKAEFPSEIIKSMGELGFMGIAIPEQYGGAGTSNLAYVVALEEISKADAGVGVIMSVNNSLCCDPLFHFGSDEIKEKYLKKIASGEWLGSYALTEPGAGSDAGAIATTAVKDGNEYVLNGAKAFITNGDSCDITVMYAKTDPEAPNGKGITAFVVEKGTPGFNVGKHEDKLGIRSSDCVSLIFEDCRVPASNVIGEEGAGFKVALATLDVGRIGIGAQALGIAQASLEESLSYSSERVQFGKPIAAFQAIQWKIADMGVEIAAARLLLMHAAWMRDEGMRHTLQSSMGKLFASETAMRAALQAVQIHGGYGYIREYPVERHMRDAKITEIYEGTSEIQRLVIARNLMAE